MSLAFQIETRSQFTWKFITAYVVAFVWRSGIFFLGLFLLLPQSRTTMRLKLNEFFKCVSLCVSWNITGLWHQRQKSRAGGVRTKSRVKPIEFCGFYLPPSTAGDVLQCHFSYLKFNILTYMFTGCHTQIRSPENGPQKKWNMKFRSYVYVANRGSPSHTYLQWSYFLNNSYSMQSSVNKKKDEVSNKHRLTLQFNLFLLVLILFWFFFWTHFIAASSFTFIHQQRIYCNRFFF